MDNIKTLIEKTNQDKIKWTITEKHIWKTKVGFWKESTITFHGGGGYGLYYRSVLLTTDEELLQELETAIENQISRRSSWMKNEVEKEFKKKLGWM